MNLPSLEFLLSCNVKSLQEMELACLNRSQQSLRAAKLEMEEAISQREAAGVARWFIEHRPYLLETASRVVAAEMGQGVLAFPERGPQLLPVADAKPGREDFDNPDRNAYPAMRRYFRR